VNPALIRNHKDLLDQHAMNAVELSFAFRASADYLAWQDRCWGRIGGDNGQTDLLCAMALAMTEMERRMGKDAPWDTTDLPMDWRECCNAFAAAVIDAMLTLDDPPDVARILVALVGGPAR
jgi:hypothetical protein